MIQRVQKVTAPFYTLIIHMYITSIYVGDYNPGPKYMVTVKAAFTNKTKLTVNKFCFNMMTVLIASPSCRLITLLDARMLGALTTVALLMQLKLLPVLTL